MAVVQFDLVDEGYKGFNKFIPLLIFFRSYLFRADAASLVAQRTKGFGRLKSLAPPPADANIASICVP